LEDIQNCEDEEIDNSPDEILGEDISPEGPCEHVTEEDGQLVFQRYLLRCIYMYLYLYVYVYNVNVYTYLM
jgi:hypothetical protein